MQADTQKLTAILVDDELHARENLEMLLAEFCPEIDVIGKADGVPAAREIIESLRPQVVFLDIRMPSGAEGFDLLAELPQKEFQVVFVTAFKDYAIQAFNANAIHYLLKPIDIEALRNAVEKVHDYYDAFSAQRDSFLQYVKSVENLAEAVVRNQKPKRITLYHSKGFQVVDISEIVRLQADNNCTHLFFADGTQYFDTKTLKVFEEILAEDRFMRLHKSHIINLDQLQAYKNQDGGFAVMKDQSEVPISNARLSAFLSQMKQI